ncbi:Na+/H+ antiporter subunit G [bacterium]|nr:Na+/H+ antiporter subunit G [bacterium]
MEILGAAISLLGSLFLLLGALGITRMPDTFNRIQAGTKATTLGTLLTLTGIAVYNPEWTPKIILLILFILLTNPVSSHVLARAAHFIKTPLTDKTVVDKLAEQEQKQQKKEDA